MRCSKTKPLTVTGNDLRDAKLVCLVLLSVSAAGKPLLVGDGAHLLTHVLVLVAANLQQQWPVR